MLDDLPHSDGVVAVTTKETMNRDTTLATWREHMSEDMRLRDLRPRTEEAYLLAVKLHLAWAQKEPTDITDEDVRGYVLHLREALKRSPSTINIAAHALRFFFTRILPRDWSMLDLLRVNKRRSRSCSASASFTSRGAHSTV